MKFLYRIFLGFSLVGLTFIGGGSVELISDRVWGDEDMQQVFKEYPFVLDYLNGEGTNGKVSGVAGPCHESINCPPGANWQNHKRAVVKLKITDPSRNISYNCTGFLINNGKPGELGEPYLLTAKHCVYDQQTAEGLEIYFNYEDLGCNSIGPTRPSHIMEGASLLITSSIYDFALLKLNHRPPIDAFP
ncbi:MAG: hypothetical protein AAFY71_27875, partial [Bacteroidota bacterium]